ncbi:hypothetical protein AURDEDRAFT_131147 [Auricularia subglabra TFB-10046 SS5]|uniref:Uncharacterized protein n=1 Tax=Auricularia subglabra (strain TFB-10046 / SS5) TaxID=717982 RepID=J0CVQ0_AURST|nr:hypothetical protein AURDEDRAFT_131147 [Auricularia subglabra TFB-10046 SS5]
MSGSGVEITDTFLANAIGSLEVLRTKELRLLSPCLALSTLTTVSATLCTESSLYLLFASCPALVLLSVDNLISSEVAHPRIPETLTSLTLGACTPGVDLQAVYIACDGLPNLNYVQFNMTAPADYRVLAHVLRDAIDIEMDADLSGTWRDSITLFTRHAGGRRCAVLLYGFIRLYRRDPDRRYSWVFKQDADCFFELRTLSIPIVVLATFVADAPALLTLDVLRVKIHEDEEPQPSVRSRPSFPWHLLRALGDARAETVVVDVTSSVALTEAEAQAMMVHLGPVSVHRMITVRGFWPGILSVPTSAKVVFVVAVIASLWRAWPRKGELPEVAAAVAIKLLLSTLRLTALLCLALSRPIPSHLIPCCLKTDRFLPHRSLLTSEQDLLKASGLGNLKLTTRMTELLNYTPKRARATIELWPRTNAEESKGKLKKFVTGDRGCGASVLTRVFEESHKRLRRYHVSTCSLAPASSIAMRTYYGGQQDCRMLVDEADKPTVWEMRTTLAQSYDLDHKFLGPGGLTYFFAPIASSFTIAPRRAKHRIGTPRSVFTGCSASAFWPDGENGGLNSNTAGVRVTLMHHETNLLQSIRLPPVREDNRISSRDCVREAAQHEDIARPIDRHRESKGKNKESNYDSLRRRQVRRIALNDLSSGGSTTA